MEYLEVDRRLLFPILRHAAFGNPAEHYTDFYDVCIQFTAWTGLESLLLGSTSAISGFEWGLCPELQILGLPCRPGFSFARLPPHIHCAISIYALETNQVQILVYVEVGATSNG